MQIVALVEHENHVCCRYRLRAFRPYLEAAGHSLEFRRLPKHWWSRIRLWSELRGQCVLLQRRLLAGWEVALLRRFVRILLFDCDDAVFLHDSYSNRRPIFSRRKHRFARLVRALDLAIAGNSFLADQIRLLRPHLPVTVVPTCIDLKQYPDVPRVPRERTRLVWVGSASTLQGLHRNRELLEHIGRRVAKIELKLICDSFLEFDQLPVVQCPWNEQSEPSDIAEADIGISWIPDDGWSRGKCGLKVLQYMAAGLPVVTNSAGVHSEIVQHGTTGFLVETHEEWSEAIARLARDPDLRRRMGEAGKDRVRRRYSVEVGAKQWIALLNELQSGLAQTG